jgi:hypothetical protein
MQGGCEHDSIGEIGENNDEVSKYTLGSSAGNPSGCVEVDPPRVRVAG